MIKLEIVKACERCEGKGHTGEKPHFENLIEPTKTRLTKLGRLYKGKFLSCLWCGGIGKVKKIITVYKYREIN